MSDLSPGCVGHLFVIFSFIDMQMITYAVCKQHLLILSPDQTRTQVNLCRLCDDTSQTAAQVVTSSALSLV